MKLLKNITLVACVALPLSVMAGSYNAERYVDKKVSKMDRYLNLSDTQEARIKEILLNDAIEDNFLDNAIDDIENQLEKLSDGTANFKETAMELLNEKEALEVEEDALDHATEMAIAELLNDTQAYKFLDID